MESQPYPALFLVLEVWGAENQGLQRTEDNHGYLSQFSSVAQSCPTLCDPMDFSTPAHGYMKCPKLKHVWKHKSEMKGRI